MTTTGYIEIEATILSSNYTIQLEVEAELVDESFSHEFGIELCSGIEISDWSIDEAYNDTDQQDVPQEDLKSLEELLEGQLDTNDFIDHFDVDDFC